MISIIIVHYHVKKHLFDCLQSIISSTPKTPYEIIVVDNDEEKTIQKDLHKKFPKVKYIPNQNKGFGQGNNVGANHAKGEYLFFLNPDTKFLNNTIDVLIEFLNKHKNTAIAAPLLFDTHNKPYPLQGIRELNPLRAIFSLSFIHKLFPKNKIYKDYYIFDWDKKKTREVDAVPGTAFIIRKKLFEKIGGFDKKFFLFFEEFDLCKRIKKLGYKIVINPDAKVMHYWGESTKTRSDTDRIFKKSRFYYFRKHFGLLPAICTESILRINKYTIFLLLLTIFGYILRSYRINETMPFIPEQGWFYLSARDMLISEKIPLVGIASSHPWLHQGAYWTYTLAPLFWIFGFNPLNGAYLSILIDVLAMLFIYKVGTEMFSGKVGIIASLLYATSSIVILNARMPYHTSPIPLIVIALIFALYKWLTGSKYYFPLIIALLVALYNFELATIPFVFIFLIVIVFGIWKKKKWVKKLKNTNIALLSSTAFIVTMAPILLHDLQNNFPQTIKFIIWMGYRILVLFGYPPLHPEITSPTLSSFINFSLKSYQNLLFPSNGYIAIIIFIISFYVFYKSAIMQIAHKKYKTNWLLLLLIVSISLSSFFAVKTPSEAYLPMLFPGLILLTAVSFAQLTRKQFMNIPIWIGIFTIAILNSHYLYQFINNKPPTFTQQISVAKQVITQANGKEYNLKWGRVDKARQNDTQNYEYLIWWQGGNLPSAKKENLEFVINEKINEIEVIKKIKQQ